VFERFTDRARRVLVLAQEEARLLNHSFIGTEHILLGLIHEGDGIGAMSLESLGISLEAVRMKVGAIVGVGGGQPSESPPFTPRAKKVLELALREALQLGHSYIGTEHLLLGLVREGEGVAATVLIDLGANLGRVRQKVIEFMSGRPGSESITPSGEPSVQFLTGNDSAGTDPRCPRCRSELAEVARFRTIAVSPEPDESDESDSLPILVDVVYCSHCGTTLATLRSEPPIP
jgi:ATP-dependent Clp protease ATP-binding subunit ClpC